MALFGPFQAVALCNSLAYKLCSCTSKFNCIFGAIIWTALSVFICDVTSPSSARTWARSCVCVECKYTWQFLSYRDTSWFADKGYEDMNPQRDELWQYSFCKQTWRGFDRKSAYTYAYVSTKNLRTNPKYVWLPYNLCRAHVESRAYMCTSMWNLPSVHKFTTSRTYDKVRMGTVKSGSSLLNIAHNLSKR